MMESSICGIGSARSRQWAGPLRSGHRASSGGQLEAAIEHLRATLQLTPNFVGAHNNLGIALASQGKMDEAIGQFQRRSPLIPSPPRRVTICLLPCRAAGVPAVDIGGASSTHRGRKVFLLTDP